MDHFKRYHPLLMLYNLWTFLKSTFFIVILLLINRNSDSFLMKYGSLLFLAIIILTSFSILLKWWKMKYAVDDHSFYLRSGVFQKHEQTIPFTKIQNTQQKTTFFHQLFRVTSISFETGISTSDSSVKFDVISKNEANSLKQLIENPCPPQGEKNDVDIAVGEEHEEEILGPKGKTLHFTPATKDTFKAAFTSFSFLFIIPIVITIFSKLDDLFEFGDKLDVVYSIITIAWWSIALVIILLIFFSVGFGILRTFIKYGKYEISSDDELIYIQKGILEESTFTISKEKVQAIQINQSFLKRILGLAEVKLISAGNIGELTSDTNSLYPFLPIKKSYELISEILPSYTVTTEMNLLPKKSFWIRLFRPSWVWIIATGTLAYFQPSIFSFDIPWWAISMILLVMIGFMRILDYVNTRYTINGKFVQFKTGSFNTSLFITKREKVIEASTSQSIIQKKLGLSSIVTINRSKPVHHSTIKDIPTVITDEFVHWYSRRIDDIEILTEAAEEIIE